MASIYFEFPQNVVDMLLVPHKYVTTSLDRGAIKVSRWSEYNMNADRVWCEQEGTVWFLKHPSDGPMMPEVDMKEFMWVKLKAEFIS